MADHINQQVLEAIQANLVAAATAAGSNVFLDRLDAVPEASIPAILIEGVGEVVEAQTVGFPPIYARQYSIAVACLASGSAKAARNLAKQVEAALCASLAAYTVNSLAKALLLTGSNESKDGSGTTGLFEIRQIWNAQIMTLGNVPDASA
jgi:hypothetical protein